MHLIVIGNLPIPLMTIKINGISEQRLICNRHVRDNQLSLQNLLLVRRQMCKRILLFLYSGLLTLILMFYGSPRDLVTRIS